jgi:Na+/H+-translocating membrane pyrophosphatase
MENLLMLAPAGGAIALLFAVMLTSKIKKADQGTKKWLR